MDADDKMARAATNLMDDREHVVMSRVGRGHVRKIFFFLDSLNLGGTERQAVELARGLDPAQYQVTLGCLRARGPLRERLQGSAVEVVEFYPQGGIDSVRGIYQVLRLAMFLRRGRYDIFHSHDLWSNLMGVPAAWLAQVPVIISSRRDLGHLDWYQSKKRPWLRRIQQLSDMVVTNASTIRDGLIHQEGQPAAKVRVIQNGIHVNNFARAPRQRDKIFPGIGEGQIVVLIGNMHSDVKGHPSLIRAAPAILQEFPRAHFVLVGDGARRADFERQADEMGVLPSFLFLGHRTDTAEILASCDVGVLPSKAEGLSNALLEYMAAGLPVVATIVGGNVEVVQNNSSGLLVPPQDEKALAAAILQLLRDPALAQRLAKRGQEHVRQHFSDERFVREIDKLYTEMLARREGYPTA